LKETTMKARVVILGAGFAGLELSTLLSETLGDAVEVTLIDKSDAFIFGFSKLDVMFGRTTYDAVRMPYRNFKKPGVRFVPGAITAIDPERRRVKAHGATYDADFLIVALGADYDIAATPGLNQVNEFYTYAGAERLREKLRKFRKGRAVVGVCGAPFKCPPAPSECALMLHDHLSKQGVRGACEITLVLPFGAPVPPSPETSRALVAAFAERNITFLPSHRVASIDAAGGRAVLDDGAVVPFDLFFGVPKHRVSEVVRESGLAVDGWIPVNPRTLETSYPGVYAVGDCANTGTPKAGVFAEGAARAVADAIVAKVRNVGGGREYDGFGVCYIEFGGERIGKVEVDFFSGPQPVGAYSAPSLALRAEKEHFGASRRARWFGM
jgi:sulfide:quinone oxidoreductase